MMRLNRRRFLGTAAVVGASVPASWLGYRYLHHTPTVSLHKIGLPLAHALRDRSLHDKPVSQHRCRVLILGGGAAGLSTAWRLTRRGFHDFLLAEGYERNGNMAAFDAGNGLTAPTGAHYLALPSTESTTVRQILTDLGILTGYDRHGTPQYRDTDLVHAPAERLWHQGSWHEHLLLPDADARRFLQLIAPLKHARGSDGRKIFAIPIALSSADETWRRLDELTFAQWLNAQGLHSPSLRHYLDYCCRDDYGQGINQVSAFAGLHYFCARANEQDSVLTWSDGLNHIGEGLRRLAKLHPVSDFPAAGEWHFDAPASCAASAVAIREHPNFVEVHLRHNLTGKTVAVHAEQVVCAMPLLLAARLLHQPERYGLPLRPPEYAPWLVSNFVLHRFPAEAKHSELAWDNVVHGSTGLGYVVATHQLIRAAKPPRTVFTAYRAFNHAPPAQVRQELLNADAQALLEPAAADLLTVYGKRFWQHVSHIDLTVRAHAMSVPLRGYLNRPDLLTLRQHRSRIVFAHSDLSGYSVFEEAAHWGALAADALADNWV